MTYGWVRMEILGGLINGVFFEPTEITQPVLLLIVAGVGLLFNVIGLVVFAEHAHGGHSHGHKKHKDENIIVSTDTDAEASAPKEKVLLTCLLRMLIIILT
jgi:Co/Zn/Cd efflux system component